VTDDCVLGDDLPEQFRPLPLFALIPFVCYLLEKYICTYLPDGCLILCAGRPAAVHECSLTNDDPLHVVSPEFAAQL